MATTVFINEIHYDNAGADTGETVEIAAPAGTNLSGWRIVLYNGADGAAYAATGGSVNGIALSGIVANQQNGFGTLSFLAPGIQNGAPDGLALVDAGGHVVQFLSYEGSFTAANGPAAGLTSTDIRVAESGTDPIGFTLQLHGTGTTYEDFTWTAPSTGSFGAVNAGQTFGAAAPAQPGVLSIADASIAEGNSGTTDLVFTVTRANGSDGAVSVDWTINFGTGGAAADAGDLGAGQPLTGTVTFAAGATTAQIHVAVSGDTVFESDETFGVTLSNPQGGVTIGDGQAAGTITNDDAAPPAGPANVFINEIHYDNVGADVGEAIEIAGAAGTNLSGWSIVLYNGNGGVSYQTIALSGVIADQQNGFGTVSAPAVGIQNGAPDGIALVDASGHVVQFLSYEGSFLATNGPAAGLTSTDIGVAEEPAVAVGQSLQLKGTGSSAADFVWTAATASSFGGVNDGQSFLPASGTGYIRIDDASVVEGDSGTANLVFTVHRAGGADFAASVDYQIGFGTADAGDLAADAALSGTVSFGVGEFTKQIVLPVQGDTVGELNETLSIQLNNPVGNIVIDDASATGTIINDDPIALTIPQIQGAGHQSAFVGQTVSTSGIVTAVDTNGFYVQDPNGDGDARTSDAIFVFTSTAPGVAVGDGVNIRGTVAEFAGDASGLTVTELTAPNVTVVSHDNALPEAILIGVDGILPPNHITEDDNFQNFDPQTDGLDFWESLESERVTIENPLVVSNTSSFGETDVVASLGVGATGVNSRGGITVSAGDFNPEKIQIDDDSGIFSGFAPNYTIGDQLSSVTGIVNYSFDSYEVIVTSAVTVTKDVTLEREVTTLQGNADYLSLATYNVENLDASDNKFGTLADNIVTNLHAPDVIALQEIQDPDGAGTGANLSGVPTAQGLIDAIFAESGLHYAYIEIAPDVANSTGGEPNGNIRNGFLYNVDRVSYVEGSAQLITGPEYNNSRRPLVAQFNFAGQTITAIDVHFTARSGSDPLQGNTQPPADAGDAARTAQAAGVKAYVQDHLADNPNLNIAILGDFNGFYFEQAQTQLTDPVQGGVFTNLNSLLPSEERYSFLFNGNAQQIDNILVTGGLLNGAQYDSVHINSQFDANARPTDHDPQVALLLLGAAPTNLALDHARVDENLAAGTVVGTLHADDTVNDTLHFSLVDDAGGRFAVDAVTGVITTTQAFDFEASPQFAITARATDSGGLSVDHGFTIAVGDVDEAPVAAKDAVSVDEDATSGNLYAQLLANDHDPDAGQTLSISAVDTSGTLGSVVFDAATQTLRYVADNDAFDELATGATQTDHFTYTVTDGHGLTSTAAVDVTVTGVADGETLFGTARADVIDGTGGEDFLFGLVGNDTLSGRQGNDLLDGGRGDDVLFGGVGNDTLLGGNGKDNLFGDSGNDTLTGGAGADKFHFGRQGGSDTITDFNSDEDFLVLDDGIAITRSQTRDVNHDGTLDLVLTLSFGTQATLLGVHDAGALHFAAPNGLSDHLPASIVGPGVLEPVLPGLPQTLEPVLFGF